MILTVRPRSITLGVLDTSMCSDESEMLQNSGFVSMNFSQLATQPIIEQVLTRFGNAHHFYIGMDQVSETDVKVAAFLMCEIPQLPNIHEWHQTSLSVIASAEEPIGPVKMLVGFETLVTAKTVERFLERVEEEDGFFIACGAEPNVAGEPVRPRWFQGIKRLLTTDDVYRAIVSKYGFDMRPEQPNFG